MTPHKENNHTTKVLNDSEGDETLISELKRMMIKRTCKNKAMKSERIWINR
jgi:hypothetical protein